MDFGSQSSGTGGFLSPKKIIKDIGIIKEGARVADFGCGHGYFTLPLSDEIGEKGTVFAIDILPKVLDVISLKAKVEGRENITIKRCNLEKEKGCDVEENSLDAIFIVNLLFQTEKDEIVIREAKRLLKDDGRIVFIEWRPDAPFGPQGKRIEKEDAIKMFNKENFKLEREFPTDNYHYGLIFLKNKFYEKK